MSSPAVTLIHLAGRDALDLLHRISTQHLRELEPGRCRTTLFCDFRGRLQHRAAVARTRDGNVWLVRPDAPGAELAAVLDAQIFRDQARVEDRSATAGVIAAAAAADAREGETLEAGGVPARLHLASGIDWIVGDAPGTVALTEGARIAAGAPRHGREVRDAFNPFEVGLARDVHLDKGCFTGQEALLRMMTYGGVRRRLVRLVGNGPAPALDATGERGERLLAGDTEVGVITSVAPDANGWRALAVVRRDGVDAGAALATASGGRITAVTPFVDTRPLGLPDMPARPQ